MLIRSTTTSSRIMWSLSALQFLCICSTIQVNHFGLRTLQFYLLSNPQSAFESIHAFENPVISFSSRTYGQLCMTARLFENPAILSWIYRCFSWLGLVLRVRLNFCIVCNIVSLRICNFQSKAIHVSAFECPAISSSSKTGLVLGLFARVFECPAIFHFF